MYRTIALKTIWVAVVLLLAAMSPILAQRENSNWHFGHGASIRFLPGEDLPIATGGSAIDAFETSAAISHPVTGDLLFYTDGQTVWDADHNVMSDGTGLQSDPQSTQGTLIVPAPCDTNRYFVFSNDVVNGGYPFPLHPEHGNRGLVYSVVDMRLNNGRGAVIRKNIRVWEMTTERLNATVQSNGRDYWVVTQDLESYDLMAFPVTCDGIGVPVSSPVADHIPPGSRYKDRFADIGSIEFSPDGRTMALSGSFPAIPPDTTGTFLDIYSFDPQTGQADRTMLLPYEPVVMEFSTDGSMLYLLQQPGDKIVQIDLSARGRAVLIASHGDDLRFPGHLQRGPDGRIYVAERDDTALSVIHSPNKAGADCNWENEAVPLGGAVSSFGLPNLIDSKLFGEDRLCRVRAASSLTSDTVCAGEWVRLTDLSAGTTGGLTWQAPGAVELREGDANSVDVVYDAPGTYSITQVGIADRCGDPICDTVVHDIVVQPVPDVELDPNAWLCAESDSVVRLSPRYGGGELTYRWTPARGLSCIDCPDPVASPAETTTYTLEVTNEVGCVTTVSTTVWKGDQRGAIAFGTDSATVGDTVYIPVIVAEPEVAGQPARLRLTVSTDRRALYVLADLMLNRRSRMGSILETWSIEAIDINENGATIEFVDLTGTGVRLKPGDTLLHVPAWVLLGAKSTGRMSGSLEVPGLPCVDFEPSAVDIPLGLCGASQRTVELSQFHLRGPEIDQVSAGAFLVSVTLPWSSRIRLVAYDATGRQVAVLHNGAVSSGPHTYRLPRVSPGIYFVCLDVGADRYCARWTIER